MKKSQVIKVSIAALASLACCATASAQTSTLRFNGWLPPFHPINKLTIIPWSKAVETATEGRVKIVFTPKSVVPPPRQIDAVASGAVDLAYNVHGFTPGRFKASRIASLPFLASRAEHLSVALWRTHQKYLAKSNEYKGVKVLTLWAGAPGVMLSHSKPVVSIEDWKGLKVFCGVKNVCDLASSMGATPVQRPGPQVTEMIERKIVDAAFIDPASYKNFRLERFVKQAMVAPNGFYAPTFYLVVNPKAWEALSAKDRSAIEKLSGEVLSRKAGADWDKDADESRALMKKNNVTMNEAGGAYLKALEDKLVPERTRSYIADAKTASVDGDAALKYLREQIKAAAQ
jgi:TRAP-type C4-dicarboxylate transport system substrate-binding protein